VGLKKMLRFVRAGRNFGFPEFGCTAWPQAMGRQTPSQTMENWVAIECSEELGSVLVSMDNNERDFE